MTRLVGRIIGVIVSSYWIVALLGNVFSPSQKAAESAPSEGILVLILVLVPVSAFIVSWRHIKLGAWIMTVSSIALSFFAYFSAGRNKLFAVSVSGLPFLISGMLLLLSTRKVAK